MGARVSLGRLAREPLYNTAAVAQATGVPPDTFRAWERRYGFPHPFRSPNNQRLYSDRDVAVINWLRERTDEGMTISQAIQRLRLEVPEIFAAESVNDVRAESADDTQAVRLRQRLIAACAGFDTIRAQTVLDDALARFSVESFCTSFVAPIMQEIGDRWNRGDLTAAVEHLATRLIVQRLTAILAVANPLTSRGTLLAACPPGEEHEVGLLLLAIACSRQGWRVVNLGANVPASDLAHAARAVHADVVCLSATTERASAGVIAVAKELQSATDSPPVIVGGRIVGRRDGALSLPNVRVVSGSAIEVAERIDALIERR